ncbi:type VI secretion system tube protein Hcp [Rahnella sp. SAP-29]|nr:type VI secretion system tube protein Hcp [Rahnella laticis]
MSRYSIWLFNLICIKVMRTRNQGGVPCMFQKEFDRSTPTLYRTISRDLTLKSAKIKMYRILDAGVETEYFNILMENMKITGITPSLHLGSGTGTHLENIEIRLYLNKQSAFGLIGTAIDRSHQSHPSPCMTSPAKSYIGA